MKKGLFIIGIILVVLGLFYLISIVIMVHYKYEMYHSCRELAQYSDNPYESSYYCEKPLNPGYWYFGGIAFTKIIIGITLIGIAFYEKY